MCSPKTIALKKKCVHRFKNLCHTRKFFFMISEAQLQHASHNKVMHQKVKVKIFFYDILMGNFRNLVVCHMRNFCYAIKLLFLHVKRASKVSGENWNVYGAFLDALHLTVFWRISSEFFIMLKSFSFYYCVSVTPW